MNKTGGRAHDQEVYGEHDATWGVRIVWKVVGGHDSAKEQLVTNVPCTLLNGNPNGT